MRNSKLILVGIFIFALLLRVINLDGVPPSLNWDEVSHGYNAYSILKTGRDEWGDFLPLGNFRAYGDYPLPLYMYLTMPFIVSFGLNAVAIRLPSAILGSLLTLVIFYLAKVIFKNDKLALLSSLLVAISPWWVMTNRQVIQSTPAVFFVTLGVTLFLAGIEKGKWKVILGTLSIGLSAYAYHNTRIIAPIVAVVLLILFWKQLIKSKKVLSAVMGIFALFFLPLIPILTIGGGSARATWVGILDQGAINRIDQSRGESSLPEGLKRVVYNKAFYFMETAAQNYVGYFSPTFLGFEGGTQFQFSVPHFGVVFPVELPFFYVGLIYLLLKFKKIREEEKLILCWLLIAPIPAAITRDPYQVVRSTVMIAPFYITEILGFALVWKYFNKRRIYVMGTMSVFVLLLAILFLRYNYNFWSIYPKTYSEAWQYGYQQAISYIEKNQDQYQTVAVTKAYGEPHEFLLFYMKYDPSSYQHDPNLIRYEKSDWFWVDGFAKYKFINDWEVKSKLKHATNVLLVTTPGNYPQGATLLKTINFLDGKAAFDIVEL